MTIQLSEHLALYKYLLLLCLLANIFEISASASEKNTPADNEPSARIYRNPEERREAGLGTEITQWLTFSGLLEIEKNYTRNQFENSINTTNSDRPDQTLQAAFTASFTHWLEAELIIEAENDKQYRSFIDEALINADIDNWGISIGIQNLPFGEYYSHFITGPLLEFGETRKKSLLVDYSFNNNIELSGFIFSSENTRNNKTKPYDWGLSLELTTHHEAIRFGLSFLSDLSETDEALLDEGNHHYQQKVSAWSAYALVGLYPFEITLEALQANKPFSELDNTENHPKAHNVELAYFPQESLQFAFRVEHSNELSEQPQWQYGLSCSWYFSKRFNIALDYLYADFKKSSVFDDDNALKYTHTLAAQMSIEF